MKERAVAFRSCPWSTSAIARRRARAPSEAYACACCSKIRPAPTIPMPNVRMMVLFYSSESILHGELQRPRFARADGLAEQGRALNANDFRNIRVVEHVERIDAEVDSLRVGVPCVDRPADAQHPCEAHVELRQSRKPTGIARHAKRLVVRDRIAVVVQPGRDVVWQPARDQQDRAQSPRAVAPVP